MTQQEIVHKALDMIFERTGIQFNENNVIVEMTDVFKKHKLWNGYYSYGDHVYIHPSLFNIEEQAVWQPFWQSDIPKEEYIRIKKEMLLNTAIEVITHEIGHWVHYKYFNNKGMHICGASGKLARKNARENFAVAFQQYVQKTLPDHNKRYQRMQTILSKIESVKEE